MGSSVNVPPPQPPPAAVPPAPMTRFQAQRALGLFAPHDFVTLAFWVLGMLFCGAYYLFVPEPDMVRVVVVLCLNIVFLLGWLIVLVYRTMVFILDLHSEVALMPEASARIAVGFMQGTKK